MISDIWDTRRAVYHCGCSCASVTLRSFHTWHCRHHSSTYLQCTLPENAKCFLSAEVPRHMLHHPLSLSFSFDSLFPDYLNRPKDDLRVHRLRYFHWEGNHIPYFPQRYRLPWKRKSGSRGFRGLSDSSQTRPSWRATLEFHRCRCNPTKALADYTWNKFIVFIISFEYFFFSVVTCNRRKIQSCRNRTWFRGFRQGTGWRPPKPLCVPAGHSYNHNYQKVVRKHWYHSNQF